MFCKSISIHALLAESDYWAQNVALAWAEFLSTLSLRRATGNSYSTAPSGYISIHALLAESDKHNWESKGDGWISIHALLAESDSCFPHIAKVPAISIHALLAESDPRRKQTQPRRLHFYPRSPCGERQQKCTKQWGTFTHMKQILWGLHLHADRQGCILPFLPLFFPYFLVRRNRGFYDRLPLALSKQDSILIKIRVQTHMLDFAFVMVSQLIKAQAVRF